jgi:hypothetical protein
MVEIMPDTAVSPNGAKRNQDFRIAKINSRPKMVRPFPWAGRQMLGKQPAIRVA